MRSVIGEYQTLMAAQRAVMALEGHLSIQGIVVTDQRGHWWRRRDHLRDRSLDAQRHADFIVSMSGTRDSIELARRLLQQQPAKP